MSTSYYYTNLTKQEWFDSSALGGSGNRHGLGRNLTARAFELLLVRGSGRHAPSDAIEFGRWAGDSIAIVGDNDEAWLTYLENFTNIYVDLIPLISRYDGFESLAEAAESSNRLYVQICHLIATRQALELEIGMKEKFGANFLKRYKDLYPKLQRFEQPTDLRRPASG
jgi:hypothetical protein